MSQSCEYSFTEKNQEWYPEAHAGVRQVLPDRLKDFESYHDIPLSSHLPGQKISDPAATPWVRHDGFWYFSEAGHDSVVNRLPYSWEPGQRHSGSVNVRFKTVHTTLADNFSGSKSYQGPSSRGEW